MGKLVLQSRKECFFCGREQGLHIHHIFYGTANRKKSEQHNMKVYLCGEHHNLSNQGVHMNHDRDLYLKKIAQRYFEENIGTRDYFIQEFGKSYL